MAPNSRRPATTHHPAAASQFARNDRKFNATGVTGLITNVAAILG